MKSIKFFSLLIALLLSTAHLSFAQSMEDKLTEEQKQEMQQQMQEFATTLNLTEEQKPKFKAIAQKYGAKMLEVRDSNDGKWKKYKAVQSIQKDRNKEMEALLTKEQYALYLEKQKEVQAKMRAKRNNKG